MVNFTVNRHLRTDLGLPSPWSSIRGRQCGTLRLAYRQPLYHTFCELLQYQGTDPRRCRAGSTMCIPYTLLLLTASGFPGKTSCGIVVVSFARPRGRCLGSSTGPGSLQRRGEVEAFLLRQLFEREKLLLVVSELVNMDLVATPEARPSRTQYVVLHVFRLGAEPRGERLFNRHVTRK